MTPEQKQCLLKYLGYYTGKIDGAFGRRSAEATRNFQRDFGGIAIDGIAGEETEKALKHAVSFGIPTREETTPGSWWDDIKYFKREEFRCKCNGKYCNGFPVEPSEGLVRILDKVRDHFGVPFTPNSAIRCSRWNKKKDGATNSQHLYGRAADISIPGVKPKTVAAYIETLIPDTGGIGIYSWGVHVDDRKTRARWNG